MPGGDGTIPPILRRIAELEGTLDGQLQDWREVGRLDFAYLDTATVWAKAVWAASDALGPARLAPATLKRGLHLARHPVFVCGAHRSGTTLLRDLLDGHPELVVLPFESDFHARFEPQLRRMTADQRTAFLGQRWLQRLANPANQPPYWLLGNSDERGSAYVEFARDFRAWCSALARKGLSGRSAPLAACALAYARRLGDEAPATARLWVEKTPGNERFLDHIWTEFPAAKIVHVVRRPDAALSSYKALLARSGIHGARLAPMLLNLARSYRIALARQRDARPDRYCLIHYEDLARDPQQTMAQVAAFLGIAAAPTLSRPTVAGAAATANTSFAAGRSSSADGLGALERDILALTIGTSAARLGYSEFAPVTRVGRSLGALLSAALGDHQRKRNAA